MVNEKPQVLGNLRMVDVENGDITDAVITVEQGRISDVRPADSVAPDEITMDLGGRYLLPGMIDCHAHLSFPTSPNLAGEINRELPALIAIQSVNAAEATLQAGVTTVRDGCSTSYIDIALKKAIERGYVPGPRMLAAGYALRMTGGHGDPPTSTLLSIEQPGRVDGVAEVQKAARLNFKMGADHLKIFASGGLGTPHTAPGLPGFTIEEMTAAVDVAHSAGGTVMAHSYSAESCRRAIIAGVDSIEHGCLIDDAGLELMVERGTALVPTLTPFWRGAQRLADNATDERSQRSAAMYENAVDAVQRAYAAGVPIAMGTDTGTAGTPHGENLLELALLAAAGMSPLDAIRAGTILAARLLKRDSEVGSITVGKYADFIAVAENPLTHIDRFSDPAAVTFVMKGGDVVRDERTELT